MKPVFLLFLILPIFGLTQEQPKESIIVFEGEIYNAKTKLPIQGAFVELIGIKQRQLILSDSSGSYRLEVDTSFLNQVIEVVISKDRFNSIGFKKREINFKAFQRFELNKLEICMGDSPFPGEPLLYFSEEINLNKEKKESLTLLIQFMIDVPLVVEIQGYTDCKGSKAYNQKLSEKRAKAVVDYLVSKGISKDRVLGKGYGETRLVNNCACEGKKKTDCSEEEHALNRRVEFRVVAIDDPTKSNTKEFDN